MSIIEWLDNRFYPPIPNHPDHFRLQILSSMTPESVVLDLGAGRGVYEQLNFRGLARKVCGVDVDPIVLANSFLDEARVMTDRSIPYDNDTFDLVICNYVMEHIEKPAEFLGELCRVLKPGGKFIARTPNRWHYIPLIAACTPQWFHVWYNARRGGESLDVFPTYYRLNTARSVRKAAEECDLKVVSLDRTEGRPDYLRLTTLTYLAGIVYERIVNSSSWLAPFRIVLTVELEK